MTKHDTADCARKGAASTDFPYGPLRQAGRAISDVSLELPDSVRDGIAEMHKRWNDRLVWNTLDVAKEYVSGRLKVLVAVDSDAGLDLDIAPPGVARVENDIVPSPPSTGGDIEKLDALDAGGLNDRRQDGVFLCVVDLAKPIQNFPSTFFVDCKLDEEVDGALEGCFYSFAGGFKINPVVTGRKFQVPVPSPVVEANELPGGVIKRRSKIVNCIAKNKGQAGRDWRFEDDFEEHRAFYVSVDANIVTVTPGKAFKCGLKVADVLIGPFNF